MRPLAALLLLLTLALAAGPFAACPAQAHLQGEGPARPAHPSAPPDRAGEARAQAPGPMAGAPDRIRVGAPGDPAKACAHSPCAPAHCAACPAAAPLLSPAVMAPGGPSLSARLRRRAARAPARGRRDPPHPRPPARLTPAGAPGIASPGDGP